jgi:hypothetical protein
LLKQKVAQKVAISLGYFILSKNHNEPPKVANWQKLPNLVTLIISLINVFLLCRPNVNQPIVFGPKEVEPSVVGICKTF